MGEEGGKGGMGGGTRPETVQEKERLMGEAVSQRDEGCSER